METRSKSRVGRRFAFAIAAVVCGMLALAVPVGAAVRPTHHSGASSSQVEAATIGDYRVITGKRTAVAAETQQFAFVTCPGTEQQTDGRACQLPAQLTFRLEFVRT